MSMHKDDWLALASKPVPLAALVVVSLLAFFAGILLRGAFA